MIKDPETGWQEPSVTINGKELSYAEAMVVRVAVTSFRMAIAEDSLQIALGPLAHGYDFHLRVVERLLLANGDMT